MKRSTFWLLCLMGCAIFNQGLARPQEDYQEDGDGEDYTDDSEDEPVGPPPQVRSVKTTQVVDVGGVAFLPCDVDGNPRAFTRIWRKGDDTGLFVGSIAQTSDPRISNLPNGSLEIRQVQPSDSDTYSCKISSENGGEVQHVLLVRGDVEIVSLMPSQKTVITKGASLTLECKVQGYPAPTIKWYHNGYLKLPEDPSHSERFTIRNATLADSGFYKCSASNEGQKVPTEREVEVEVHYPPQILIGRATVPTGEGYEAELKCTVIGMKKPHLKWYKSGEQKPIVASEKFKLERKGEDHILQIKKVQPSDFGDYTCEAKNSEVQEQAEITLTGKPARPEPDTIVTEDDSKNPLLSFRVESYAPIEDYELLYKREEKDEWFTLKPKVVPSKDHIYIVKYALTGLEPGVYNAQLKAKNAYGWSEMSSKVTFPKEHEGDLHETGQLAVEVAGASELRISVALVVSLLVAHFYC